MTVEGAESGIKSAEGRNVYYSPTDLLALTVREYLLSMGLSFEVCQEMLETLKATESWLFQPSVLEGQMKRFMLLLDLKRRCLVNFDSGLALETIYDGSRVKIGSVPGRGLWCLSGSGIFR